MKAKNCSQTTKEELLLQIFKDKFIPEVSLTFDANTTGYSLLQIDDYWYLLYLSNGLFVFCLQKEDKHAFKQKLKKRADWKGEFKLECFS
jgi:hypothetical protein